MSDNLRFYEKVKTVPDNAKKPILGGRLKGMTDINPMWRIKALTETFGPVGIGWKYDITNKFLERCDNGEVAAFVDINLFYRDPKSGEWSEPIPGTGGSMFVAKEKNGPRVSDECFKMALTDALSVACKAIGVGSSVYWDRQDESKYGRQPQQQKQQQQQNKQQPKQDTQNRPNSAQQQTKQQRPTQTTTQRPKMDEMANVAGKCSVCNTNVTKPIVNASMKTVGKIMCMNCMKKNANPK